MKQKAASRSIKILVAKLGLDGHDRGALVLCRAFRDAGMEVIYSGLFATPDRVAQIAEDEDVDAIAMSLLNGAHGTLFPRVVKALKKKGIKDVLVVGGGVIPEIDHNDLVKSGVNHVFGPGTPLPTIRKKIILWNQATSFYAFLYQLFQFGVRHILSCIYQMHLYHSFDTQKSTHC
jgi:methylmalonyl-CoA mutase C-terminal domain/subunit